LKVLVAGSSGLIGTALCSALGARGDEVIRLIRRPAKSPDEVSWSPESHSLDVSVLAGVGAVVNLAGAGVGDQRWTPVYKQTILQSRVDSTATLANALAEARNKKDAANCPEVFVAASAIGYYGETGESAVTETSPPGTGFLAEVCVAWEAAATPAQIAGVRVVHPRTGLVMSPNGGALARMLPIFKAGLGGKLGNGKQWWSFISLADEIRAICALINDSRFVGPVNLTAPHPARNSEVTKALGQVLGRPTFAAVPAAALKAALGEFSIEVLGSAKVLPSVLEKNRFDFLYPDIDSTLRNSLS
jgi:uncharacterized protein (TIGR01777 family)